MSASGSTSAANTRSGTAAITRHPVSVRDIARAYAPAWAETSPQGRASPRFVACAASSDACATPSLANTWLRCTLTVPRAMNMRSAICGLVRPAATSATIRISVGVRLAQPDGRTLAFAACSRDVLDHLAEWQVRRPRSSAARTSRRRAARAPTRCVGARRVSSNGRVASRIARRSASAAAKQRTASVVLSASNASAPSASSVAAIPGPQVVPHLARERGVQQVFGRVASPRGAGDECALVLRSARAASRCRAAPLRVPSPRRAAACAPRRDRRRSAGPRRAPGGTAPATIGGASLRERVDRPARRTRTRLRRRRSRGDVGEDRPPHPGTASPLPAAFARAINASSPAAASCEIAGSAARASSDHASANPPVEGSPTSSAACSRPVEGCAGVCEVAAMHREVADLERYQARKNSLSSARAIRSQLVERVAPRPLRRARRSTRPSSSSSRRRRPSRRRSPGRARCCAPSWARPASRIEEHGLRTRACSTRAPAAQSSPTVSAIANACGARTGIVSKSSP